MKKEWYFYVNGLSDLGSRMHLIAVTSLLLSFANSGFWLMAFFVARQVGGILSSLYAGILADWYDRRRLMITSDIICGTAITSILLFPHPITVVFSAFVLGVMYNLFQTSFQASIPEWFGQQHVRKNNALIISMEAAVGIVGFTVGGLISDQFGYQMVILFDAFTFWFSALCLARLRWSSRTEAMDARARPAIVNDLLETSAYMKQNPLFLTLILLGSLYSLSASSWNYCLPILSAGFVGQSSTMHGMMWSAVGAGSFLGSLFWARMLRPRISVVAGSMLLFGGLITLSIWVVGPLLIICLLIAAGMVDSATGISYRTMIQASVNQVRGRILGVQALLSRAGFLVGFLVAPTIVSHTSLLGLIVTIQLVVAAGVCLLTYHADKRLT